MGRQVPLTESQDLVKDMHKKLRALRIRAGMTQEQAGNLAGKTRTWLANIERGTHALRIHHYMLLCEIYRVYPDHALTTPLLTAAEERHWNRKCRILRFWSVE